MKGIRIVATGKALPKKRILNQDLEKLVDTSDEWIRSRTGIRQRYRCQEETCTTLAIEAAERAMQNAGIKKEEVGAIIVATATTEFLFPSTACLVQKALGFPTELLAFDLSAACSGFVYGIEVCRGLLMCGSKRYALLIGSEQFSKILDDTDRSTCVLFGDGAGAAVLELSDSLYVHKAWADGDVKDRALWCEGIGSTKSYVQMNGQEVYRFAVQALRQGIETVLEEAQLTMNEIDCVICHQANVRIIEKVRKRLGAGEEKFFINIDKYANTSAASIPIALDECYESGMLKKGMKVICVGFGGGFTWSSVLLTV